MLTSGRILSRTRQSVDSTRVRSLGQLLGTPWAAVLVTALLCLGASWWGYTEIWNADQWAFKDHFREGAWPFSPASFDKPPLLTYLNFVFSVTPRVVLVEVLELLSGKEYGESLDFISVWLAKLLQALFACGSVWLLWRSVEQCVSRPVALAVALFLATSAGLIVQAHLITTDLPVVFFMLLAFYFSQRLWTDPRMVTYVTAGLLTGLTGAMKYNGLVIGVAMVVFHLWRTPARDIGRQLFDRRFLVGLCAVPAGFLLGNPFAAIEFRRFWSDLHYLFVTSPQYIGASGEARYNPSIVDTFAMDLMGWPLVAAAVVGIVVAIPILLREGRSRRSATFIAAAGTAAFYCVYFGSRTNVQVRWLLTVVPLILIAAAPGWEAIWRSRPRIATTLAACLIVYGVVCCINVDRRFASDPRLAAVTWVSRHVPAGATIESSPYVPKWSKHPSVAAVPVAMPPVTGRVRLFDDLFAGRPEIIAGTRLREVEDVEWYSMAALRARSPDYIAASSLYFDRYFSGTLVRYYPEMRKYFATLLAGDAGYEIVFDQRCCASSPYLYPRSILFVDNRTVILKRKFDGR